jgi:hypothetical protein
MNSNPGIQNVATVAWNGTASRPYDIRKFVRFGWSFEVIAALAADTVFKVEAAPPSDADPCVPGAWADVPEVSVCERPAEPAATSQITIPAGTPIGTICAGTIPCRPNAFVRIVPVSGDTADVLIALVRQGPMT